MQGSTGINREQQGKHAKTAARHSNIKGLASRAESYSLLLAPHWELTANFDHRSFSEGHSISKPYRAKLAGYRRHAENIGRALRGDDDVRLVGLVRSQ